MFDQGIDPYGDPWRHLKPQTITQKRYHGKVDRILVEHGDLRKSGVSKAMKSGYKHGFTDPKAKFHDKAKNPDKQRKLLPDDRGLPERSKRALGQILSKHLTP